MPVGKGIASEWLHPAQSTPWTTQIQWLLPLILFHLDAASAIIYLIIISEKNYKWTINSYVINLSFSVSLGPETIAPNQIRYFHYPYRVTFCLVIFPLMKRSLPSWVIQKFVSDNPFTIFPSDFICCTWLFNS